MLMHHVLIILTLTLIQGRYTALNRGNNKHLIISKTIQAMPIKFAVKTAVIGCIYDHCQSDDLDLDSMSQVRLKVDYFLTCNISDNIFKRLCYIQTCHDGGHNTWRIYAHACFDDLYFDARS